MKNHPFGTPLQLLVRTAILLLILTSRVHALILTGGDGPVHDPGWPTGAAALAGQPSRIFYAEGPPFGGGEWTFFHRGNTAALQQAIDAFAAIAGPTHTVRIHPGHPRIPYAARNEAGEAIAYDWSFTVWRAANWEKLFGPEGPGFMARHPDFGAATPPLRFDVWAYAGGPDWAQIRVPAGIEVLDGRGQAHGYRADRLTLKVYLATPEGRVELQPLETNTPSAAQPRSVTTPSGQDTVTLKEVVPGDYRVVASAPGHASRVLGSTQVEGDTYLEYTASLALETTVLGRVLDSDGKPVAGVEIVPSGLVGPDGRGYELPVEATATTDAEGRFRLTGLPEGKLQLRAYKPGWQRVSDGREWVELPSGELTIRLRTTEEPGKK
jgi:hypothetical protein